MITDKIKALFQFIEFLHSNIENFNQYNHLINELNFLADKRSKLKPLKNFKDKLQYDEVQTEIQDKFKILQDNTANLIKGKAKELNVCSFEKELEYNFNGVQSDIHQLKNNFCNDDLPEIFKHKNKYIEYRTNTHNTFLSLQFFFDELDEITKSLFDYFKDTDQNEFEAFVTKPIDVDSITELAEIISGKNKLNIEIDKNLSITEKLDYWKSVIDKHFNEPLTEQFGEYEFTFEQEQAKKKQLIKLFGTNYSLISPLLIPERIYNKHFENALNEPEFTYWFLQHNAQTYFNVEIKMKRLPEKLKTLLSENFIKAELKKLNDFEQKAESLLNESKFDIYNDYSFSEYDKEIEYLRIKADYYKTHALPSVQATGNTTVVLYAEHIYLKKFLETELQKILLPKEFKVWLTQDDLYEYYFKNPKQQQSIYEDYQREQVFKDLESWIEWMSKNPELAKKYFPDFTAQLEERIRKLPPHQTANIIQKLPENFFIWKADIDKLFGKTKTKKIKEQIQLLEMVLNLEFETEIEQQAFESVRDELTEQLKYWNDLLKASSTVQDKKDESDKPECLSNIITHEKSSEIVEKIKVQYKNIKGKSLGILLKAMQEKELLPLKRIGAKFYRCCKREFDWDIAKYQAMNDFKFTKGYETLKGRYIESEDEKELKSKIQFLESIINSK